MLLLGYFEGIDSERGIAWRAADQLELPQVSGLRSERADAGSFDGVADPAFVLGRDASCGDEVGAEDSAQTWAGGWPERVHRRHHLAGQRVR